jgi:chromosome segregation ATPase
MKKMLLFVVVGLVLFSASAGVSWILHKPHAPSEEEIASNPEAHMMLSEKTGKRASDPHAESAPASVSDQPRAIRPSYTQGAEEAVHLADRLKVKETNLKDREKRIEEREKLLKMVYKDIEGERAALDQIRKVIQEDMTEVKRHMDRLEQKKSELLEKKEEVSAEMDDMKKMILQMRSDQQVNLRKMTEMINKMDPSAAGKILRQLVESGSEDTAVQVLSLMQEKQAAKVLPELPEAMSAKLVEKMKYVKKPPKAPAGSDTEELPAPTPDK